MSAIQSLRQDAYARGVLDSNEYQTVSVQHDGNTQVVVVQPTNPQVVFVPQYQPYQVWYSGPSTGDVVAASVLSFGAGIALGSWLNNSRPWGWGGWGWGGRGMIVNNNVWVVNNRWRSPRPYFRARPPRFIPLTNTNGDSWVGTEGISGKTVSRASKVYFQRSRVASETG